MRELLVAKGMSVLNTGNDPAFEGYWRWRIAWHMTSLALLLLNLESIFKISNMCIDDLVEELYFISCSASGPILRDYTVMFEGRLWVISETVTNVCSPTSVSHWVEMALSLPPTKEGHILNNTFLILLNICDLKPEKFLIHSYSDIIFMRYWRKDPNLQLKHSCETV